LSYVDTVKHAENIVTVCLRLVWLGKKSIIVQGKLGGSLKRVTCT